MEEINGKVKKRENKKRKVIKKFTKKCGIKKVWNPNQNDLKILKFLHEFIEGSRANLIKKYCGMKTSTLYKRLNILKDRGLIINEFPQWKLVNGEVKFVESLFKSDKDIFELHHPAYVVRLLEVPNWWNPKGTQMKNKLMMIKGYQFQMVKDFGKDGSNPYIQLKNDKFVIQMYPESIIVIHRKRYYSNDPYELTINFMNDFYDFWDWFEDRMKFKFFKEGVPQMTLRGHDYNRINDWMANYVKKKVGHKILIEIGDGRKVWIDLSEPFGKEANTPEIQVMLEKHTKDIVLNKPMLNSELQLMVQKVTENQIMFAENMTSHVKAIQDLSKGVNELIKAAKKLK